MSKSPNVLLAPPLPSSLDSSAQWLAGEGAGSWFVIHTEADGTCAVKRYGPNGEIECEGIFRASVSFVPAEPFTITYPSHCQTVSILQGQKLITLTRL